MFSVHFTLDGQPRRLTKTYRTRLWAEKAAAQVTAAYGVPATITGREDRPQPGMLPVGSVLHGCEGVTISRHRFFEITWAAPDGRTVKARELRRYVESGSVSDPAGMRVRPVITGVDRFAGPEVTYRVRVGDGGRPYIRDGYDCYATPMEPDRLLAGYLDTYFD